ncbi:hypothetical protein [Endozoicomonas sp. SESOKO1]|uniref:hypothetical protein n=1 Tax=Endozoicomonas sp. SESOKO1 TaxID=2828742 RepID=UPI002148E4BE|nr:hypothetical protein [Endozoicomonas sp. SESOKO1]
MKSLSQDYSPASSAQLNEVADPFLYFQDTFFSESGISVRALSREVVEAANILCSMCTDKPIGNDLHQTTALFHNPFDHPRLEKRSIAIVDSHTAGDQSQCLPIVNNNLHPPLELARQVTSNQGRTDIFSKSIDLARSSVGKSDESHSLTLECQGEHHDDSTYAERQRQHRKERNRERYRNDPAFAESIRERNRKRYQNDPAFAERQRCRIRERQSKLRKDPAYLEHQRKLERARQQNNPDYAKRNRGRYQNDPAYAERLKKYNKERYHNDPAYAERQKERQRELRKDPAFLKHERERRRKRYKNDPDFAERERGRQRERYQNSLQLRKTPKSAPK